jgi:prevent-host-death family protein
VSAEHAANRVRRPMVGLATVAGTLVSWQVHRTLPGIAGMVLMSAGVAGVADVLWRGTGLWAGLLTEACSCWWRGVRSTRCAAAAAAGRRPVGRLQAAQPCCTERTTRRRLVGVSEAVAEMPISEARDHLAEVIGRARYAGAETILTHYGSPAAVVISFEEYQRLKGVEPLVLPPEIEAVIEDSRRHPELDAPRPVRARPVR